MRIKNKIKFCHKSIYKIKVSLSIESISKKLKIEYINLNTNYFDVISFVNYYEISGLILSK